MRRKRLCYSDYQKEQVMDSRLRRFALCSELQTRWPLLNSEMQQRVSSKSSESPRPASSAILLGSSLRSNESKKMEREPPVDAGGLETKRKVRKDTSPQQLSTAIPPVPRAYKKGRRKTVATMKSRAVVQTPRLTLAKQILKKKVLSAASR